MSHWNRSSSRGINSLHGSQGTVSIEFALIFPIFLLLLFAAYELGIYLHDKQVVTYAAREGARFGITMQNPRPNEQAIRQIVIARSDTLIAANLNNTCEGQTNSVNIAVENGQWISGNDLTVDICTPYSFPLLSNLSGFPEIPLFSRSVMVLE